MSFAFDLFKDSGGASLPRFATPISGKTGGGFMGARKGVGLCILKASDFGFNPDDFDDEEDPSKLCGGVIGRGNKICILRGCRTGAHRLKKHDLQQYQAPHVFIKASKEGDSVFAKPVLPASSFSEELLERYQQEERGKDDWEIFFRGISNAKESNRTEESISAFAARLETGGEEVAAGPTPLKKRRVLEIRSPALAAGFEVAVGELLEELGTTDSLAISNLRAEWRKVRLNFKTLQELIEGARDSLTALSKGTREEFTKSDIEISRLSTLVGRRSDDMGTLSAFDLLEMALEDTKKIEDLQKEVRSESKRIAGVQNAVGNLDATWEAGLVKKVLPGVGLGGGMSTGGDPSPAWEKRFKAALREELGPLLSLYFSVSSSAGTPGDKLDRQLAEIKQEINNLRTAKAVPPARAYAPSATAAAPATFGLWGDTKASGIAGVPGLSGGSAGRMGSVADGSESLPSGLDARLNALEQTVRNIEDQLEGDRVDVMGIGFKSLSFTRAWLKLNANRAGAYVCFADAHALMTIAAKDLISSTEVIKFQSAATKSGYASAEDALVAASFSIELPSLFGKESDALEATKDSRVLPGIRTFKFWDANDGYTGARYVIARKVADAQTTLVKAVNGMLGGGIQATIALTMINESAMFITELVNWVTAQYLQLVGRGGNPEEVWKLLCQSVRAVFRALHVKRAPGRGPFIPGEEAACRLWGCLQAYKRMQEFKKNLFAADPELSHILNMHLQDNAVMKRDLEKMHKQIETALKAAKEATEEAQRVKRSCDSAISRLGAKGGNKKPRTDNRE